LVSTVNAPATGPRHFNLCVPRPLPLCQWPRARGPRQWTCIVPGGAPGCRSFGMTVRPLKVDPHRCFIDDDLQAMSACGRTAVHAKTLVCLYLNCSLLAVGGDIPSPHEASTRAYGAPRVPVLPGALLGQCFQSHAIFSSCAAPCSE